jgi:hypothetical protein
VTPPSNISRSRERPAAHHHEVDLEPLGLFNERSRDVVRAVADAMQHRIDPVMLKMIGCIKTGQRLELGRMLLVDHHGSGLRLVQVGHRLGQAPERIHGYRSRQ